MTTSPTFRRSLSPGACWVRCRSALFAKRCAGSPADWVVLSEAEDDIERLLLVGAGPASILNLSVGDGIL